MLDSEMARSRRRPGPVVPQPAGAPWSWLDAVLAPVPTPPGITSREIVRRAIEYDSPARIPYSFVMPPRTDFFEVAELGRAGETAGPRQPRPGEVYRDEWGIGRQATGLSADRVVDHPLGDLRGVASHPLPELAAPGRFAPLVPFLRRAREAGKYVVGADPVVMYERMRELVGFESLMAAPYAQPERLAVLLDRLTDLTVAVVEQLGRIGVVDAFMTWQDFGMQSGLQMRLETFQKFYAPRYQRVVEAAHRNGMHFIWHNCGQILDMIPGMIDLGVDVVQMDQPRLMGHRQLAERFGGRICFWNTVDIQWATSGSVSRADLRAEVAEMVRPFARLGGGLMVRHYPEPRAIGLGPEFHEATYEAFLANGCGLS